ncbi:MAG: HPr(Ser) kinase/phosphatase [Tissierellia bacterium]|nr:HPr(Ser) kinase/phosphatase [Tissierellia bacterium]
MEYLMFEQLLEKFDFEVVNLSTNYKDVTIYSSETNRPGLQLAGYYQKFAPERLQVIGNAEWQYLKEMTGTERRMRFERFFSYPIPALIFTSNNYVFDETKEVAKLRNMTVLKTKQKTASFLSKLINFTETMLSPKTSVHGVLVEVYGIGVLIIGDSGIGKSETALDLIIRGHKLISDDIVNIVKIDDVLTGTSPDLTKYFMEIRGIGILDVERMYGISSTKESNTIDLVIKQEMWDNNKEYDRLGFDEDFHNILNTEIPMITLPMKPGRNAAMIVEVAARNFKQKKSGYNATEVLNSRIIKKIQSRKSELE